MKQNSQIRILVQDWFNKAKDDELSGKILLEEGGAPSTICFLAQQMAEKYLKGLLTFYNKDVEKTHDIIKLANLINTKTPDISSSQNDLIILARYYIETRYPGDWPEGFSMEEAYVAFEAAKRIKKFVLEKTSNQK